jgi:tRNA(His) 5'-end guanylyltransferase
MSFDELDERMRAFETALDQSVPPDFHIVVRLDGRGFTRLTRELQPFEAPFDERFRDLMLETGEHLMQSGFRVLYGYTQSDEISLLLARDEAQFDRKLRKLLSILAGEASARFSLSLGGIGVFDARLSPLPTTRHVLDYFRWRQEDAGRNALNAHGYWLLRNQGRSAGEATATLKGLSVAEKNELLFRHGINFNRLASWRKRGVGIRWESYPRDGSDPRTGAAVTVVRRRLTRELELPRGDEYEAFLTPILAKDVPETP